MGEKWELKHSDPADGITPAQVISELRRCGLRVTERALESWRKQGWLPPLERVEPVPGRKDARYVWRDRDVLLRVFSLLTAKQVRGRMDSAVVMTWLAGFEYPVSPIAAMWADFELLMWRKAIRHASAGGPIDVAGAVDVLVGEAHATRQGRKRSREFVDALIRLDVDPDFDPTTDLSLKQADKIRGDLGRLSREGGALMEVLRPEHVRMIAAFIQDFYSAPRLAALIRTLSAEELAALHRDCRFVMGLYRGWLREAMNNAELNSIALHVWPRIAWQGGQFLMLLGLALRRAGFGPAVDGSVSFLEEVFSDAELRDAMKRCRRQWEEILAIGNGDQGRVREEVKRRVESDPDFCRLWQLGDAVLERLVELWGPITVEIRAYIEDLLASASSAPLPSARLAVATGSPPRMS